MNRGVKTTETIKVDSKGRVSIPKSVRKSLSLERGTELEVSEDGGKVVLTPLLEDPVEALFDVLSLALPKGMTATEIQRKLRAEWERDIEKEMTRARGTAK